MLKKIPTRRTKLKGGRFAIVAAQYNGRYVDAMVRSAKAQLQRAGAEEIQVLRVPGAFEIPVVAALLASQSSPRFSAIICLGVVLRGATAHAQHIGEAVSHALAQIQMLHQVPVIHAVLLLENETQAKERCLDGRHNRGLEAAQTAIRMGRLMASLR